MKRGGTWVVGTLTIVDAASEANDVTIAREGDSLVVHDASAQLQAGAQCLPRDPHTAVCSDESALRDVAARLGDGDDRVQPSAPELTLDADGGAGNDTLGAAAVAASGTLAGGPGDDRLIGDRGMDDLRGGRGRDTITGGSGRDRIDGGRDADAIDGGPQQDGLTYIGRAEPLRVDLAKGVETTDGDRLAGIEDANGGDGPDVLAGTGGRNRLAGGKGADTLHGRGEADQLTGDRYDSSEDGGDDTLRGGPGGDVLSGGGREPVRRPRARRPRRRRRRERARRRARPGPAHPDRVAGRGRARTRWDCGPGRDTVESDRPVTVMRPGCEVLSARHIEIARAGPGVVRLTHRLSDGKPCRVGVALDGGAPVMQLRSLQPRRLALPARTVRLTFSPAGGCDLFDHRFHVLVPPGG